MAQVTYENATKRFGKVTALSEFSLPIEDGEFMVFVGPSGSGKTTALRLLAGLESLSSGHIWIGNSLADRVSPRQRDIGMVFQDYALYPQMTVFKNLAFGLRMRKIPRRDIDRRVKDTAELLGLGSLLDRKPAELSGGQRQRVALGRALVREPQVFLMDEPLSNLDAKLRVRTRSEIKRLQRRVGTTTVYVTHDQVEAMTMGDRVALINDGVLQQVATPDVVYENPANLFVAGFIGSPSMSFNRFGVAHIDGKMRLSRGDLQIEACSHPDVPEEVIVGVRPEHARLWDDSPGLLGPFDGRVQFAEPVGRETFVGVTSPNETYFALQVEGRCRLELDEPIRFGLQLGWLYLFDPASEQLVTRI